LRRNVKRKKNDVVVVNFGNLMRETVVSNVGRGRVSSHQRNPCTCSFLSEFSRATPVSSVQQGYGELSRAFRT
jgi:hypothetical protein